jgi:uncharacterized membrane protein YkoI
MRLIAFLYLFLVLAPVLGLPDEAAAQQGGLTLDQAVKRVKENRDVKVLSAERTIRNGEPVYRIKVLTRDGRVKYIWVNAGK